MVISKVVGFFKDGIFSKTVSTIFKNAPTSSAYFQPSGEDSPPLNGDLLALVKGTREGQTLAVGVIDHKNKGLAKQGEKYLYCRNTSGEIVAFVHMKNDGSIELNNGGKITLQTNGSINLNGLTIDVNGNLSTLGDVTSKTVTLATHTHLSASPGSPTTPPTPGT